MWNFRRRRNLTYQIESDEDDEDEELSNNYLPESSDDDPDDPPAPKKLKTENKQHSAQTPSPPVVLKVDAEPAVASEKCNAIIAESHSEIFPIAKVTNSKADAYYNIIPDHLQIAEVVNELVTKVSETSDHTVINKLLNHLVSNVCETVDEPECVQVSSALSDILDKVCGPVEPSVTLDLDNVMSDCVYTLTKTVNTAVKSVYKMLELKQAGHSKKSNDGDALSISELMPHLANFDPDNPDEERVKKLQMCKHFIDRCDGGVILGHSDNSSEDEDHLATPRSVGKISHLGQLLVFDPAKKDNAIAESKVDIYTQPDHLLPNSITEQISSSSLDDREKSCTKCDFKSKQFYEFMSHSLRHKVLLCRFCSKSYTDTLLFKYHVQEHTAEFGSYCSTCKISKNSQNLNNHIKNVHNNESKIMRCTYSIIRQVLYGYLCTNCRLVKLSKCIMDHHLSKSKECNEIVRINMAKLIRRNRVHKQFRDHVSTYEKLRVRRKKERLERRMKKVEQLHKINEQLKCENTDQAKELKRLKEEADKKQKEKQQEIARQLKLMLQEEAARKLQEDLVKKHQEILRREENAKKWQENVKQKEEAARMQLEIARKKSEHARKQKKIARQKEKSARVQLKITKLKEKARKVPRIQPQRPATVNQKQKLSCSEDSDDSISKLEDELLADSDDSYVPDDMGDVNLDDSESSSSEPPNLLDITADTQQENIQTDETPDLHKETADCHANQVAPLASEQQVSDLLQNLDNLEQEVRNQSRVQKPAASIAEDDVEVTKVVQQRLRPLQAKGNPPVKLNNLLLNSANTDNIQRPTQNAPKNQVIQGPLVMQQVQTPVQPVIRAIQNPSYINPSVMMRNMPHGNWPHSIVVNSGQGLVRANYVGSIVRLPNSNLSPNTFPTNYTMPYVGLPQPAPPQNIQIIHNQYNFSPNLPSSNHPGPSQPVVSTAPKRQPKSIGSMTIEEIPPEVDQTEDNVDGHSSDIELIDAPAKIEKDPEVIELSEPESVEFGPGGVSPTHSSSSEDSELKLKDMLAQNYRTWLQPDTVESEPNKVQNCTCDTEQPTLKVIESEVDVVPTEPLKTEPELAVPSSPILETADALQCEEEIPAEKLNETEKLKHEELPEEQLDEITESEEEAPLEKQLEVVIEPYKPKMSSNSKPETSKAISALSRDQSQVEPEKTQVALAKLASSDSETDDLPVTAKPKWPTSRKRIWAAFNDESSDSDDLKQPVKKATRRTKHVSLDQSSSSQSSGDDFVHALPQRQTQRTKYSEMNADRARKVLHARKTRKTNRPVLISSVESSDLDDSDAVPDNNNLASTPTNEGVSGAEQDLVPTFDTYSQYLQLHQDDQSLNTNVLALNRQSTSYTVPEEQPDIPEANPLPETSNPSSDLISCPQCKVKEPFTESSLTMHLFEHYNIKPFICGLCTEQFADQTDLDLHARNFHRKIFVPYRLTRCPEFISKIVQQVIHGKTDNTDESIEALSESSVPELLDHNPESTPLENNPESTPLESSPGSTKLENSPETTQLENSLEATKLENSPETPQHYVRDGRFFKGIRYLQTAKGPFQCTKCPKVYTSSHSFIKHVKMMHFAPYQCSFCKRLILYKTMFLRNPCHGSDSAEIIDNPDYDPYGPRKAFEHAISVAAMDKSNEVVSSDSDDDEHKVDMAKENATPEFNCKIFSDSESDGTSRKKLRIKFMKKKSQNSDKINPKATMQMDEQQNVAVSISDMRRALKIDCCVLVHRLEDVLRRNFRWA